MPTLLGCLIIFSVVIWALAKIVQAIDRTLEARSEIAHRKNKAPRLAELSIRAAQTAPNFSANYVWVTIEDQRGLAIDQSRGLLMLITGQQRMVVGFDKIVSCEIREDNASLMISRRGPQGMVLGALLRGELGAIVGGMASPQRSTIVGGVRSITLLIVINDFESPNHLVTFLFGLDGAIIRRNSPAYLNGLARAQLWHSRLTIAMERAGHAETSELKITSRRDDD
jgi:hypothetical protein